MLIFTLAKNQFTKSQYNQAANLVYTQQTTNLEIKAIPPQQYMQQVLAQTNGSPIRYGTITDEALLKSNLTENDIPASVFEADFTAYEGFLSERRILMALKIKRYYESL